METTEEQREWLRLNWSVGESTFRQWVAGSDRAHEIVPRALRDVDTLLAALRRIGYDEELSYLACAGAPHCDGSHYDSCPVAVARAVLGE
jgi:hypothetical protein